MEEVEPGVDDLDEGWVEATGVFDTENFPTDLSSKDTRGLWEQFKRPFAGVPGGEDVGWTMKFPPEKERLFRSLRRSTWKFELLFACRLWIALLLFITILTWLMRITSSDMTPQSVASVALVLEAVFTGFLIYLTRRNGDYDPHTLGVALGVSIVVSALGFRYCGGSSSMIYLALLMVYGFLNIPLFMSVALVLACMVGYFALTVGCGFAGGTTNSTETAKITLQFLVYLIVNAFGCYYAYFNHFFTRHNYLKTLVLIKNERAMTLEARKSDLLLKSILPKKVIWALKNAFSKTKDTLSPSSSGLFEPGDQHSQLSRHQHQPSDDDGASGMYDQDERGLISSEPSLWEKQKGLLMGKTELGDRLVGDFFSLFKVTGRRESGAPSTKGKDRLPGAGWEADSAEHSLHDSSSSKDKEKEKARSKRTSGGSRRWLPRVSGRGSILPSWLVRSSKTLSHLKPSQQPSSGMQDIIPIQVRGHTILSLNDVSILFGDIVGFTAMSSTMPAETLVDLLNEIFCKFDDLSKKYGIEKIKTLGDCYMACAGIPERLENGADCAVLLAKDMIRTLSEITGERQVSLKIRIGIHTGKVNSGVVGMKKFIYDVWSDDVSIASKMESTGEPNHIQISEATHSRLTLNMGIKEKRQLDLKQGRITTFILSDEALPLEDSFLIRPTAEEKEYIPSFPESEPYLWVKYE